MNLSWEQRLAYEAKMNRLPAELRDRILAEVPYASLVYVAGSRAYGLNHEDSDWDVRCMTPPTFDEICFQEDFNERHLDGVDVTLRSVRKTLTMLWRGNPNIIELFALPADCLLYADSIGRQVIGLRSRLLTRSCLKPMEGYMMHARHIASRPTSEPERARKAMMHAVRIHRMMLELAQTGRLNVRRAEDWSELLDIREHGRDPKELDRLLDIHDGEPATVDGSNLPEPLDENEFRDLVRPILMQTAMMALRDA